MAVEPYANGCGATDKREARPYAGSPLSPPSMNASLLLRFSFFSALLALLVVSASAQNSSSFPQEINVEVNDCPLIMEARDAISGQHYFTDTIVERGSPDHTLDTNGLGGINIDQNLPPDIIYVFEFNSVSNPPDSKCQFYPVSETYV